MVCAILVALAAALEVRVEVNADGQQAVVRSRATGSDFKKYIYCQDGTKHSKRLSKCFGRLSTATPKDGWHTTGPDCCRMAGGGAPREVASEAVAANAAGYDIYVAAKERMQPAERESLKLYHRDSKAYDRGLKARTGATAGGRLLRIALTIYESTAGDLLKSLGETFDGEMKDPDTCDILLDVVGKDAMKVADGQALVKVGCVHAVAAIAPDFLPYRERAAESLLAALERLLKPQEEWAEQEVRDQCDDRLNEPDYKPVQFDAPERAGSDVWQPLPQPPTARGRVTSLAASLLDVLGDADRGFRRALCSGDVARLQAVLDSEARLQAELSGLLRAEQAAALAAVGGLTLGRALADARFDEATFQSHDEEPVRFLLGPNEADAAAFQQVQWPDGAAPDMGNLGFSLPSHCSFIDPQVKDDLLGSGAASVQVQAETIVVASKIREVSWNTKDRAGRAIVTKAGPAPEPAEQVAVRYTPEIHGVLKNDLRVKDTLKTEMVTVDLLTAPSTGMLGPLALYDRVAKNDFLVPPGAEQDWKDIGGKAEQGAALRAGAKWHGFLLKPRSSWPAGVEFDPGLGTFPLSETARGKLREAPQVRVVVGMPDELRKGDAVVGVKVGGAEKAVATKADLLSALGGLEDDGEAYLLVERSVSKKEAAARDAGVGSAMQRFLGPKLNMAFFKAVSAGEVTAVERDGVWTELKSLAGPAAEAAVSAALADAGARLLLHQTVGEVQLHRFTDLEEQADQVRRQRAVLGPSAAWVPEAATDLQRAEPAHCAKRLAGHDPLDPQRTARRTSGPDALDVAQLEPDTMGWAATVTALKQAGAAVRTSAGGSTTSA